MEPGESSAKKKRSAEHWIVLLGSIAALGGLIALGFILEPDARGFGTHESLGLKPCMPMELWNFPCPGCGVTTAATHAARGDLLAALRAQPFGLLLSLALLVFVGWAVIAHARGRDLWDALHARNWSRFVAGGAFLMALAWIYKIGAVRGWY